MALAAMVKSALHVLGVYSFPVSVESPWEVLVENPDATETAALDGGAICIKPGAVVASTNRKMEVGSKGTSVAIALKYNPDTSTLTSPIIRVFGQDRNGKWHTLKDAAGADEVTLTLSETKDAYYDTTHVICIPKVFDCQGSLAIMVCVQTAFNANAGTKTDSVILGKILNSR